MAPAYTDISPRSAVTDFLSDNVWLPIVAVTLGVIVVVIIVYCVWRCRHTMRYDYSLLKSDLALPQKLEMERKLQYDTMRETALLQCQLYLRSSGVYTLLEHLPEIGSRINKHWFVLRDVRSKTEKLMAMVPKGPQMLLPFTSSIKNTLSELLLAIQHPYIFPMYELDLLIEQDKAVIIFPYNSKGSLKDAIYHAHCMDTWSSKYYLAGTGLEPNLIALYSRQILEGLLYLQRSGFPPFLHLHSGNVLVQNNTCRITGYESEFLGLPPKLYGLTTRKLKDDSTAVQTICFGHLVYEMAMGNELEVTFLQQQQLEEIQHPAVREFLEYLFSSTVDGYHSLQELAEHPFVKDIALIEMQVFTRPPVKFSKAQKSLLKVVKKGKPLGQRKSTHPLTPRATPT